VTSRSLRLPITLPPNPLHRRTCGPCIQERLGNHPGIRRAVVVNPDGDERAYLELDYDAAQLSLAQINGYLRTAGSCFAPMMEHMVLAAAGLDSSQDERTIQRAVEQLPGVRCVVNAASRTVRLEFDRTRVTLAQIEQRLAQLGVRVRRETDADVSGASQPSHWLRAALTQADLVLALLAGVFLLAGFLVHVLDGPQPARLALLVVSYVCGGFYPAQDSVRTLRRFRLDIDVLMFAAAFGAASLGHYEEGAMLLFLFSLGGAGENLAMSRARHAISALTRLAPRHATLILDTGEHREVPVGELRIGDRVFVPPGQQVPADGKIAHGDSAVDQSPITGESVPVEKTEGDPVFAGTINGNGALEVEVLKRTEDNTLSKMIRLVAEAQSTRSPTQAFTDKVERWYVPAVVVATALIAIVPPLLRIEPGRGHASDWAGWFYQAMAFLTAASPCALAIGTPAAILSGIARAARGGVLIKGGIYLETLGRVRAVAFDKTGTLTVGKPQVTDAVPLDPSLDAATLIDLAATIERGSRHPLALAIVTDAEQRGLPARHARSVEEVPGVGIRGDIDGRTLHVGRIPDQPPEAEALKAQGKTVVALSEGERSLGLIALADEPRPGVREMIEQLHRMGVRHTVMLTGDNARTAAAIARRVGLDHHLADLLPEAKLVKIRELEAEHRYVAMVGDGVNDAPALATATVGIAIGATTGEGAGGSDVAIETADIVVLGKNLHRLAEAVGVSRFSRRIIQQNLLIALGVIATVAPIAALGGAPISVAVLLHEGSTVVVVLNALRILRYRAR